jgi:hypothetical protein
MILEYDNGILVILQMKIPLMYNLPMQYKKCIHDSPVQSPIYEIRRDSSPFKGPVTS